MYCIYLHKNLINGKVYIGQTKFGDDPNRRWKCGDGYRDNIEFYTDIKKFGWDNFSHEILENFLTLEQANHREQFYIDKFNSINPKIGYNKTKGGGGYNQQQRNNFKDIAFNTDTGILKSIKTKQSLSQNIIKYQNKYNRLMKNINQL